MAEPKEYCGTEPGNRTTKRSISPRALVEKATELKPVAQSDVASSYTDDYFHVRRGRASGQNKTCKGTPVRKRHMRSKDGIRLCYLSILIVLIQKNCNDITCVH